MALLPVAMAISAQSLISNTLESSPVFWDSDMFIVLSSPWWGVFLYFSRLSLVSGKKNKQQSLLQNVPQERNDRVELF
jgi:hypothetical protein